MKASHAFLHFLAISLSAAAAVIGSSDSSIETTPSDPLPQDQTHSVPDALTLYDIHAHDEYTNSSDLGVLSDPDEKGELHSANTQQTEIISYQLTIPSRTGLRTTGWYVLGMGKLVLRSQGLLSCWDSRRVVLVDYSQVLFTRVVDFGAFMHVLSRRSAVGQVSPRV